MKDINESVNPAAESEMNAEVRRLEAEAADFGISVAKLVANRRNSLKSSGPKSEEGKRRARSLTA
jgi:hypothetical protein